MKKSKLTFWLFVLPLLIPFLMVVIWPAVNGIYYSLTDWNGIGKDANFIGLSNYVKILTSDAGFFSAFRFTAIFSAVCIVIINLMGFCLALLVTQKLKGVTFMRGAFFVPNLIGGVLLGFIWQFIFIQGFEAIGKLTGISGFSGWLSDTKTASIGLVIVVVWQLSGYMMLIYVAQLQSIPQSLTEAAQIDGASALRRLMSITLPLMRPAFTIGIFLTLSHTFKLYDQNLTLTDGDPYGSTEMLALNIYNTAFDFDRFGEAQAKAVIFLIIVVIISSIQLYFGKKKEVEM
ncbi:MAG: carbohydrate transporter rane protein 1, family [Clostridia bacterium]|jgi:raffinose/stachyose/melibiose transport system permease protein|nr:carbohydrate transporter rane protein 1, family [Clostridia bacterium]